MRQQGFYAWWWRARITSMDNREWIDWIPFRLMPSKCKLKVTAEDFFYWRRCRLLYYLVFRSSFFPKTSATRQCVAVFKFLFLINILISVISFDVGFLQLFDHTVFSLELVSAVFFSKRSHFIFICIKFWFTFKRVHVYNVHSYRFRSSRSTLSCLFTHV